MILVTGASGFLGSHLVKYLSAKGQPVRALYNKHAPSEELKSLPNISWARYDLLDIYEVEEMMKGITEVYHCAAIVSFNPDKADDILHFNAESTANIVNQALQQGIRKMVHVSSVAAIGRTKAKREITEEEEWEESKYNSIYGKSKYAAELEVWRGIGEGLNAAIINPTIILGAGNWDEGSAGLMKMVYNEFPFYTTGITGWVDVEDVVRIMYMLMQSDVSAERFILSSGNEAYKDVFTMMAKELGKKPPHIKASPLLTGLIWRWFTLLRIMGRKKNLITKETAANAQNVSLYNNTKLTGYFPNFTYTPLSATIQRMAQSFKKNIK